MSQPLAQRDKGILSDAELLELSELTAFTEGEGLCWGVENEEPVGGFWSLAEEVAKATATGAVKLRTGQERALFAMRAFYLLGVLRGGEAYRNCVIDADTEPEFKDLPFQLDQMAAEDFADDLRETEAEYLARLLSMLGLSVPWAADGVKGVAT